MGSNLAANTFEETDGPETCETLLYVASPGYHIAVTSISRLIPNVLIGLISAVMAALGGIVSDCRRSVRVRGLPIPYRL
jgi:hypothetical protein